VSNGHQKTRSCGAFVSASAAIDVASHAYDSSVTSYQL